MLDRQLLGHIDCQECVHFCPPMTAGSWGPGCAVRAATPGPLLVQLRGQGRHTEPTASLLQRCRLRHRGNRYKHAATTNAAATATAAVAAAQTHFYNCCFSVPDIPLGHERGSGGALQSWTSVAAPRFTNRHRHS